DRRARAPRRAFGLRRSDHPARRAAAREHRDSRFRLLLTFERAAATPPEELIPVTPFQINPSWYETYWLQDRPSRWRRVLEVVRRVARGLTASPMAPHSRAVTSVYAWPTPSARYAQPTLSTTPASRAGWPSTSPAIAIRSRSS